MNTYTRNYQCDAKPEDIIRSVINACSDCDTCRFLMGEDCLFFPELYRLADQEADTGQSCSDSDLRQLVELCTLCGLCPCPNIRTDVIKAKTAYIRKTGMSLSNRLLVDVQRFGRVCGMLPGLVNAALSMNPVNRTAKRFAGIHPERRLPVPPSENFFAWAKKTGLCRQRGKGKGVAYFAGCTAGYLFPEVAKAAVTVLGHSGLDVFVPQQQCCGMPFLLEGDDRTTFKRVKSNLDVFSSAKDMGYDTVSSCPTCGFLTKVLLKEGAYHSDSYQQSIGAGADEIKIPDNTAEGRFIQLKKSIYGKMLRDDGLFNNLDPLERIALSDNFSDIGEYLVRLLDEQRLSLNLHALTGRMVYYAPCHQREQKIGTPYMRLLALVPGLNIEQAGGAMDCCGMGGSLGLKKKFHGDAMSLGIPLMKKIMAVAPEVVITDCLSCRLQFQHLMPCPVLHPLEILAKASDSF